MPRDLAAAVVRFATLLRRSGLPVTLVEVTDAVRALDHLDIADRRELYLGLRAVFVTRPEEVPRFDRCFEAFWRIAPDGDDSAGFIPAPAIEDLASPGVVKAGPEARGLALDSWGDEEASEARRPAQRPAGVRGRSRSCIRTFPPSAPTSSDESAEAHRQDRAAPRPPDEPPPPVR